MNKTRFLVPVLLLILIFSACCRQEEPRAKYVFYFIGDGMGLAQAIAAEAYQSSINGNEYEPLSFRRFPITALVKTVAANRFITGSAAAGTALATGNKTNINRIGLDPSGEVPFMSVAYQAKDRGMKVGIISSVSIDHATPASFYANEPDRNMYFEIGRDLAESGFDFFGGGGFLAPEGVADGDSVNLIEYIRQKGYQYINSREAFEGLGTAGQPVVFVNPQLTDGASMYYAIDQPDDYITLADITAKAINYLDNDSGFFMMVEGGKIDWVAHANDVASLVHEVIDFSEAVAEAVRFYKMHPDETLIVVTADHETGGLALGTRSSGYDSHFDLLKHQDISGESFNDILRKWRDDSRPDEISFEGFLALLEDHFGLGDNDAPLPLSIEELQELKTLFQTSGINTFSEYGAYSIITYEATHLMADKAGFGWTTSSHTGIDVPVYAIGVNSSAFTGNIDNTDIPKIIWDSMD